MEGKKNQIKRKLNWIEIPEEREYSRGKGHIGEGKRVILDIHRVVASTKLSPKVEKT